MNGHPAWRVTRYELDGVFLSHRARGGDRPVLLVHGIGPGNSGWLNYSRVIDLLRCGSSIHVIDLAGFGASGRLGRPPFFDVSFWLRQLDLAVDTIIAAHGRPPLLVGNSAGGLLVLKLAARRPDVRQVVAIGIPAGPPTRELRAIWTAPVSKAALEHALAPVMAGPERPDEVLIQARLRPFLDVDYAHYYNEMLADPELCLHQLQLTPAEAASIEAKLVLVHGRDDRPCPAADVLATVLPLLPTAEMRLLGGCGHSVCTERPAEMARLIHQCLEEAALAPVL